MLLLMSLYYYTIMPTYLETATMGSNTIGKAQSSTEEKAKKELKSEFINIFNWSHLNSKA